MIGKLYGWRERPVTAVVIDDHDTASDDVPEGSVMVAPIIREGLCTPRVVQIAATPIDGAETFVVSP